MRNRPRAFVMLLVLALVALASLIGCRAERPEPAAEPPTTTQPTTTTEPAATRTVRVYLTRGEKIGVAGRQVPDSDDTAIIARAAVAALLMGPTAEETEFGLGTVIPAGTSVNDVSLEAGVATVDLSRQFESGGGSLSMLLRVAQVVCTLTQFEDVQTVAFKLDGEPVTAVGGEGVVVDPPVSRNDFEGQLPSVLVESPVPGEAVTSPLTVSGSSNVFEATHQLNVTDPDGLILMDKFVTATSGTGTRGTWSETVEFGPVKRDGLGAVIVFEYSAKDGSRQNIVEIPVRMAR